MPALPAELRWALKVPTSEVNGFLQSFPLASSKSANFRLHAVPYRTYSKRMPLGLSAGIYTKKAEVVSLPGRQHANVHVLCDFCMLHIQVIARIGSELASIVIRVPRLDWG